MLFKRNRKRQTRVVVSFKHGTGYGDTPRILPDDVIDLLPGQVFQVGIGVDTIWEGNTVVKEYVWIAGFTRTYQYYYL